MFREVIHRFTFQDGLAEQECIYCHIGIPNEVAEASKRWCPRGDSLALQIGHSFVPLHDPEVVGPDTVACTSVEARKQSMEIVEVHLLESPRDPNAEVVKPLYRTEQEKMASRMAWENWKAMREASRPSDIEAS